MSKVMSDGEREDQVPDQRAGRGQAQEPDRGVPRVQPTAPACSTSRSRAENIVQTVEALQERGVLFLRHARDLLRGGRGPRRRDRRGLHRPAAAADPRRPRRRRLPAADLHEDGAGPADAVLRGDRAPRRARLRRGQLQGPASSRSSASRRSAGTLAPLAGSASGDDPQHDRRLPRPRPPAVPLAARTEHRPWPLPERPWAHGADAGNDLLFAHWPVDPDALRPHAPARARARRRSTAPRGSASRRSHLRPAAARDAAGAVACRRFGELNVRTYVTAGGKPGIWFFSLDADEPRRGRGRAADVPAARTSGRGCDERDGEEVDYSSARCAAGRRTCGAYHARTRPAGDAARPRRGDARAVPHRALLPLRRGRRATAARRHPPRALAAAAGAAEIELNTMPPARAAAGEPPLHYAERIDTVIWPPEPIR